MNSVALFGFDLKADESVDGSKPDGGTPAPTTAPVIVAPVT